jgi:hypothetical protein
MRKSRELLWLLGVIALVAVGYRLLGPRPSNHDVVTRQGGLFCDVRDVQFDFMDERTEKANYSGPYWHQRYEFHLKSDGKGGASWKASLVARESKETSSKVFRWTGSKPRTYAANGTLNDAELVSFLEDLEANALFDLTPGGVQAADKPGFQYRIKSRGREHVARFYEFPTSAHWWFVYNVRHAIAGEAESKLFEKFELGLQDPENLTRERQPDAPDVTVQVPIP